MFERVSWSTVEQSLAENWRQGEHVVICAPTGRGKTYLAQRLLPRRDYVVMFGTKTYDEEYKRMLKYGGFHRIRQWPPKYRFQNERSMLWPDQGRTIRETMDIQERVFRNALDRIFQQGRRTVYFDELHWIANELRLYKEIAALHHQGRSSGLTFVDSFQRPAFVPPVVYSSATHVFTWGTNHADDLKRLQSVAKLDALSRNDLIGVMGGLDEYEHVYVNVRGKQPPVITQVGKQYA